MHVDKLKFTIHIKYNCDEGEGCSKHLEDGSYDETVKLFEDLDSKAYSGYYNYMAIYQFDIEDEGRFLDLSEILYGEYEWLDDCYSTSDRDEANEIPKDILRFLALLKDDNYHVVELKQKIESLEKELEELKAELAKLERKS